MVGYATSFGVALAAAALAVIALHATASSQASLARHYADRLVHIERLRFHAERVVAVSRGYLMSPDPEYLQRIELATAELDAQIAEVRATPLSPASATELATLREDIHHYVDAARNSSTANEALRSFVENSRTQLETVRTRLDTLAHSERESFEEALEHSRDQASRAALLVGLIAGIGLALSALVAVTVMRRLANEHAVQGKAANDARQAAAAGQEVLAIVSHDLRGALATVVMGAEVLAAAHVDRPQAEPQRALRALQLAADRMKHLVDQILHAAEVDADSLRLTLEQCAVAELVHTSVAEFSAHACHAQVNLCVDMPRAPAVVRADREHVLQVLANLLGNALKFTPPGGMISVQAQLGSDDVELSVEDTGPGIPAGDLAHLFDRYWHADRNGTTRGVGLGLYICKKLIDAQGGRIWVESRLGEGTRFHFTLPRLEGTS